MSKQRKAQSVSGWFETTLNKAVDSHTLMDHPDLLQGIFNRVGLDAYYDYYVEHGQQRRPAGETHPIYHGQSHSFQVALNCYEGGLYSGLSNKELRTLLAAALFHDACHTRGLHSDAINIDNALRCFSHAQDAAPEHQRLKPEEYQEAKDLIKLTEYPYKVKKTTSTLARILRDADVMTAYTSDVDLLTELFLGLIAEAGIGWEHNGRFYGGSKESIDSFREKQKKFVTLMEWNTAWAKIKAFKRDWPQAGRRLDLLLQHAKTQ